MVLAITDTANRGWTVETDDVNIEDARVRALIGGVETKDGTWIAPGQIVSIREEKNG